MFYIFVDVTNIQKMSIIKDKTTFDPSLFQEVDICDISIIEEVVFTFENFENWEENTYSLKIFNSRHKNTTIDVPDSVSINGKFMDISIDPSNLNLDSGKYFYQIFDETLKRIVFQGNLNLVK